MEKINLTKKIIIHAQYLSQFRLLSSNSFKFWKLSYQHIQQGSKAVVNDDIGLSLTMQNTLQLELGCFYRIGRQTIGNEQVRLMSESLIPMLRIRMQIGRKLGMELSYSYDFNVSKLNNTNTVSTNEISLNIYQMPIKKFLRKKMMF